MKYDCDVIRDLLPLYIDGIANEKSNRIIEEHLKECKECKEYYEELKKTEISLPEATVMENKSVIDYGKKIRRKRKRVYTIVGSTIAVLFLSVILMVAYIITGGFPVKNTDAKKYGVFEDFKGYSNLYVFPTQLPQSAEIDSYYYYQMDTFLDPTCQIFLEYSLSEEDFNMEKLRLSEIHESYENEIYKNKVNSIVYDTENFIYPAYVTIFNNNHCYEYALINEEEHKIICVFIQFIRKNKVKFDKKFLPKDFGQEKSREGFNMYYSNGYFERHIR